MKPSRRKLGLVAVWIRALQRPLRGGSPKEGRATEGCDQRPPALSLLQSGFIKLLVRSTLSNALQGKKALKEGQTLILAVLDISRKKVNISRKKVKMSRELDRRGNGQGGFSQRKRRTSTATLEEGIEPQPPQLLEEHKFQTGTPD
uniref:Uncharacterized protein n=1 Tax=Oryza meridionalis TaxID=40149 RepID=A0A0E0C8E1_9ORYZ